MSLIHVCKDIQARGIQLDRGYVEEGKRYEQQQVKEATKDFEKDTGRTFKDSSRVFAEIFAARGETFPLTNKGNPSFTAEFLNSSSSPTAKLINRIRFHQKRYSTYWTSFVHYSDEQNVLHPELDQAGTVTGRFASRDPNLQNIPKEDTGQYKIRGAFIPREGYRLVSIDYDQQEYRLMLDYAGEMGLIEAVNNGKDVHTATAELLNIPRRHAKTVNFAMLYGTGKDKLAQMLGISVREAISLKHLYFSRLPKVKALINGIIRAGEMNGCISNWLGRKYWCGNFDMAYKLPNWLIQGGGADVIKVAMIDCHEYLKQTQSHIALQVHDELLFEIHEKDMAIIDDLKHLMSRVYKPKNGMHLTCSHEVYPHRWGVQDEAKEVLP